MPSAVSFKHLPGWQVLSTLFMHFFGSCFKFHITIQTLLQGLLLLTYVNLELLLSRQSCLWFVLFYISPICFSACRGFKKFKIGLLPDPLNDAVMCAGWSRSLWVTVNLFGLSSTIYIWGWSLIMHGNRHGCAVRKQWRSLLLQVG